MDPIGRARVGDLSRLEAELADLWREASDDEAVIRACLLNLVVVCGDDGRALDRATRLVARISETEPGRALVLAPRPDSNGGAPPIDAWVSAHCHERGSGRAPVCSEQITIEFRGAAGCDLIPATLLQLLVEEMPVHTLWRRPGIAGEPLLEPLIKLSDHLMVDSATSSDPIRFLRDLDGLATRTNGCGHVADVVWARLDPWREAIASFFDATPTRGVLEAIESVEVTAGEISPDGGTGAAGAYVAGWLATRLGWNRDRHRGEWRRPDGRPVRIGLTPACGASPGDLSAVRIDAAADGSKVSFLAERPDPEGPVVRLREIHAGRIASEHPIRLPDRDVAAVVCGMLQHSERDPVFEAALGVAARMVAH